MLSLLMSTDEVVYVAYLKKFGWWSVELVKNVKDFERVNLNYGKHLPRILHPINLLATK